MSRSRRYDTKSGPAWSDAYDLDTASDELLGRISDAYRALRWTWHRCGIPSAADIRTALRRDRACILEQHDCDWTEAGGLRVELVDGAFRFRVRRSLRAVMAERDGRVGEEVANG